MSISSKVTIAIPTRNRLKHINELLKSYASTTPKYDRPLINFVLDCPGSGYGNWIGDLCGELDIHHNFVHLPVRSSLTQLWNYGIIMSDNRWTLTCGDDIQFQEGWAEFLEKQIDSDRFWQINLHAYSAFCINKSFILQLGWFDERYRGGGFEDIDWQLRISERGLKHMVDMSQDCKYATHHRMRHGAMERWANYNNPLWIRDKWGRESWWDYTKPSFRRAEEIDWHPIDTKRLEEELGFQSQLPVTNARLYLPEEVYP